MYLRGRAFAHGAMGRRIDPSRGGPIELFLVPASAHSTSLSRLARIRLVYLFIVIVVILICAVTGSGVTM